MHQNANEKQARQRSSLKQWRKQKGKTTSQLLLHLTVIINYMEDTESEFTVKQSSIFSPKCKTEASNYMTPCPVSNARAGIRIIGTNMPLILYLLCSHASSLLHLLNSLSSSSTNCKIYFSIDPLEVGKPKRWRNSTFWWGGVVFLNVDDSSYLAFSSQGLAIHSKQ